MVDLIETYFLISFRGIERSRHKVSLTKGNEGLLSFYLCLYFQDTVFEIKKYSSILDLWFRWENKSLFYFF